jgi:Skp family chaperone for outer membrane proteins
MNAEDELISELRGYARVVQSMKEELQEKDDALQNALQEKDSALQEKDSALQEKDSALQEKDSALQEKDNAITNGILQMLNMNIPEEKIAQIFNVSLQDIQKYKK